MYSIYVKHASQFPTIFLNVQNYRDAELYRGDADAPEEESGYLDLPYARARKLSNELRTRIRIYSLSSNSFIFSSA